jgi:hypothetical protein
MGAVGGRYRQAVTETAATPEVENGIRGRIGNSPVTRRHRAVRVSDEFTTSHRRTVRDAIDHWNDRTIKALPAV